MLCASLRHRDDEFVAWPRTLAQFRAGRMTAIPLVHPWGNRLERGSTASAGAQVDLAGLDLPTDPNGLPMHGNLRGAPFEVVRAEAGARGARLVARLDYGARPDLLRAFPFPHVVTIDARLDRPRAAHRHRDRADRASRGADLVLLAPVRAAPRRAAPRVGAAVAACERVLVDERVIPTGERAPQPAERAPLADRTFDDHYALGADRRFALAAAGRTRSSSGSARRIRSRSSTCPRAATSPRSNR